MRRMNILSYLCVFWLTLYMKKSNAVLADETLKYVCSGDSIHLFQNVTIDNIDMVVSLHMNASYDRILAMWTLKNDTISDGYTMKVFRDKNDDIWIRNVFPSDEAQYILRTVKRNTFVNHIVTLSVQVAPTINCKPKIIRVDDVLVASLNPNDCGKPLVSVNWLDYSGNQIEGNQFMLPKTNKNGIYYACISGPALKCANTSKLSEYCSAYAVRDTHDGHDVSSKPGTECSESKYVLVMLVANNLVLVLVIIRLLLSFRSKCSATNVEKGDYNAVPNKIGLTDVSRTLEKVS